MTKKVYFGGLRWFNRRFFSREALADQIASLCPDNSKVLDVGCDDGSTAELVMKYNASLKIEGVDVQSIRRSKIPRRLYDGKHLPFDDGSFDVVMAIDMLHHTHHIPALLGEMGRVATKKLIVKDHAQNNFVDFWVLCALDYLGNSPYGIKCVYNFPSYQLWSDMFTTARLIEDEKILFGQWWYKRIQPIFVLSKT